MKAEHRKELETNALADRVGHFVQTIKQRPQKKAMIWVVLAIVAVVVVLLLYRRSYMRTESNSLLWEQFGDNSGRYLQEIIDRDPESNQAKAALFEFRYILLRDSLRKLASKPKEALAALDDLDRAYGELAKLVSDDKVLLPEALFAQAVIEETRIIKDDDNWKNALTKYKDVADNHADSAFGKLARQRVEILENKKDREEVIKTYQDLRQEFLYQNPFSNIRPDLLPPSHPPVPPGMSGFPPNLPVLPPPEPPPVNPK